MNLDAKGDEKEICSGFKYHDLNDLKNLINVPLKEPYRNFNVEPDSIIDGNRSIKTIDLENICEMMKIIEEINKKVNDIF